MQLSALQLLIFSIWVPIRLEGFVERGGLSHESSREDRVKVGLRLHARCHRVIQMVLVRNLTAVNSLAPLKRILGVRPVQSQVRQTLRLLMGRVQNLTCYQLFGIERLLMLGRLKAILEIRAIVVRLSPALHRRVEVGGVSVAGHDHGVLDERGLVGGR